MKIKNVHLLFPNPWSDNITFDKNDAWMKPHNSAQPDTWPATFVKNNLQHDELRTFVIIHTDQCTNFSKRLQLLSSTSNQFNHLKKFYD